MKILTVKQCCFCVDLKIAGITLGVLDILLHFYLICMEYFKVQNMYYSDPYYDPLWEGNAKAKWIIALNCIAIFVGACWIRGIFQEKPRLMLPTLFTTSVIIAYLIFSSIAALCASSQFDEYTIFEILVLRH
ncbi:uncharacterized protein LOC116348070 isoform X2 [Contarinia nasturtii]|uniref:uncharacterized protein LOC116348070 isoform X2 n=1 Tax=Contarinia nasturtii TaxID=265458 RepID=UPI0012D49D7E|nr:uncharacterized protein LOC116348070 isoform X2 [Contarinia nasturtii]